MAAAKPPPGTGHIPDLSLPPPTGRAQGAGSHPTSPEPRLGEEDIDWMEDFGPVPAQRTMKKPQGRKPLVSADFDWMEDDGPAHAAKGIAAGRGPTPAIDPAGADMDWLDVGSVGGPATSGAMGGSSAYLGGGFDFEDDFDQGGEVDVAAAIATDQPKRDLPTGITPTPEELEITEAEVAMISGYGPKPGGWYLTPSYSVRVLRRRRVLERQLTDLRRQLEQVETERDRALWDVATDWRPRLESDERFRSVLQNVDDAESRLRAEMEGLACANEQYRHQVSRLESARERLENSRKGLLDVESQLHAELEAREEQHRRLLARLQRLQIVLRNAARLEVQAREPADGVRLAPDHAAQVAEARQQLPLAKQAEQAQAARVKEAVVRLREARDNTQVVNKELREVDAQRRQVDQQFTQESTARNALVSDGERQRRTVWADVARALLSTDRAHELSDDEVSELNIREDRVKRVASEFHRHAIAVDAFDREAYRTGFFLMGVVGGGLLLLTVLAGGYGFLSGRPSSEPKSDAAGEQAPPDDGRFNASEEEWEQSK